LVVVEGPDDGGEGLPVGRLKLRQSVALFSYGWGWRETGLLEDALLLLVHGGPVRHGVFLVDGDRVSLELDPLVCGVSGWLKSISSAPKPIILKGPALVEHLYF